MKRGYIRLLSFLACIIAIILIDTFYFKILSGYSLIIFVILLIGIFHKLFVLEKDNHRYFKDVLFEIFFYTVLYFILFYLLGLLVGLYRTPNYLNVSGFKNFIIPITLFCVFREILRYNLLCKADGNKICIVLVVITILLLDICDDFAFASFKTQYSVLKFVALTLFPSISRNISYSYISKKLGYKPVIIFDLIFSLYPYIIPILPNPSEYLMAMIYLMVPILFVYRLVNFFEKKKDKLFPSNYKKRKAREMILPTIIIMVLVFFYSGYFKLYAIAIASGSMSPSIKRGDIVIVNQKVSVDKIEVGDVLAYRHDAIIVVHRVVNKIKIGDLYYYYTQGDANNNVDDLVIEEDMIIGTVKYKIPYIGYPTVWFNKE